MNTTESAQEQVDADLYDVHRSTRHGEHTCPSNDWHLCEENLLLRALVKAYEAGDAAALYSAKMDLLEWDDRDV